MPPSKMPPCPLPIDFEELFLRDPLDLLKSLADCGDMVLFRMGNADYVFINSADEVESLLVTQAKEFGHAKGLHRMAFDLGEGLLTSSGENYFKHRRISQRAFRAQKINNYHQQVISLTQEFAQKWPKEPWTDLSDCMMQLTLVILGDTLFNVDLKNYTRTIIDNMAELVDMESEHHYENIAIHNARKALDKAIYEILVEREKCKSLHDDLYDELNSHFDSEGMSFEERKKQMRDSMLTMILAGHETTASVLAWVWNLLSRDLDVYQRMVEECRRFDLNDPTDLSQIPYVQAVLSETMRLYPPVWLTGRRALVDTQLGGYFIPKNTTVVFSQYLIQRREKYFDDPGIFNPERWLEKPKHPKHAYLPFGAGHRKCIGADFAWMEASLILVTLLKSWEVTFSTGSSAMASVGITMRPRYGVYAAVSGPLQKTDDLGWEMMQLMPIMPKFLTKDLGFQAAQKFLGNLKTSSFPNPFAFEMDLSAPSSQTRASLTLGFPAKEAGERIDLNSLMLQMRKAAGSNLQRSQKHIDALSILPTTSKAFPRRLFVSVDECADGIFDINGIVSTFDKPLELHQDEETLVKELNWLLMGVENFSQKDLSLWRDLCGTNSLEHLGVATQAGSKVVKIYPMGTLRGLLSSLPEDVHQDFFNGCRDEVAEMCETMGTHQTNLVLDIVDGVLRRVGIELKLRHKQIPRPEEEVALLFDCNLLRKSLSTHTIRELRHLNKPQSVNGDMFLALNHMKVSFTPGAALQWKAYCVYL